MITQEKINYLKSFIDDFFDIYISGSPNCNLFFKEIISLWKSNLDNLENIEDLKIIKKSISKTRKNVKIYIQEENQKVSDNLRTLDIINNNIMNVLKIEIEKILKNPIKNYEPISLKGDKNIAINLVDKLKNDFNLQTIIIHKTDNWDKVSYWAKLTRKSLTKFMKDFNLSKEKINLNGKLTLHCTSLLTPNESQGACLDNDDGYFTLTVKPNKPYWFLESLIHEYTHIFDHLAFNKLYSVPSKERNLAFENGYLSSFVLMDLFKDNININKLNNKFLNNFQETIVKMVSDESIIEISQNYEAKSSLFFDSSTEIILSSLLGDLKSKLDNLDSEKKEKLVSSIKDHFKYYALTGITMINANMESFFSPTSNILKSLISSLKLNEEQLQSIQNNKNLAKEKISKILKEWLEENNFCNLNNPFKGSRGFFGTSPYMKTIIKHANEKNINLGYWTETPEILARHVQSINRATTLKNKTYGIFFPKLTRSQKILYKQTLHNLVEYSFSTDNEFNKKAKIKI